MGALVCPWRVKGGMAWDVRWDCFPDGGPGIHGDTLAECCWSLRAWICLVYGSLERESLARLGAEHRFLLLSFHFSSYCLVFLSLRLRYRACVLVVTASAGAFLCIVILDALVCWLAGSALSFLVSLWCIYLCERSSRGSWVVYSDGNRRGGSLEWKYRECVFISAVPMVSVMLMGISHNRYFATWALQPQGTALFLGSTVN